jgi:hypothetical protein
MQQREICSNFSFWNTTTLPNWSEILSGLLWTERRIWKSKTIRFKSKTQTSK